MNRNRRIGIIVGGLVLVITLVVGLNEARRLINNTAKAYEAVSSLGADEEPPKAATQSQLDEKAAKRQRRRARRQAQRAAAPAQAEPAESDTPPVVHQLSPRLAGPRALGPRITTPTMSRSLSQGALRDQLSNAVAAPTAELELSEPDDTGR